MSRIRHHTKQHRKTLYEQGVLPWWKLKDGPPAKQKQQWVQTIRSQHKFAIQRAIQQHWDELALDNPRRLTHIWDWV